MIDLIVALIIAGILAMAGWYIWRSKKNGQKCIGCPDSKNCSGNCCECRRDQK